ncbi:MAG: PEP-CTERM sorting domain-containing protein [Phycisphaerae bacterium]|nr:PEP-CTERM sorting domain-containing protein [Gemmatimonadaceae bacterium]
MQTNSGSAGVRRATGRRINRSMLITALALFVHVSPAEAQGSGSATFRFTQFRGPFQSTDGTQIFESGVINTTNFSGLIPTATGTNSAGFTSGFYYDIGSHALNGSFVGLQTSFGGPATIFDFTGASYSNIGLGTPFLLGSLTFTNGVWLGSGATAANNVPTELDFEITTTSSLGSAFTKTITGTLTHVVNGNADCTIPSSQLISADWVYLTSSAFVAGPTSSAFRVLDKTCSPAGSSGIGTVELWGAFNSLDLLDFRNPSGGILTPGIGVYVPPSPTVVPEPSTVLLVGAGIMAMALGRVRRRGV